MQDLFLDHTSVVDIRPLASCTSLYKLDLEHTSVVDIRPLASRTSLQTLRLRHTSVVDIRPVRSCLALSSFYLSSLEGHELDLDFSVLPPVVAAKAAASYARYARFRT